MRTGVVHGSPPPRLCSAISPSVPMTPSFPEGPSLLGTTPFSKAVGLALHPPTEWGARDSHTARRELSGVQTKQGWEGKESKDSDLGAGHTKAGTKYTRQHCNPPGRGK